MNIQRLSEALENFTGELDVPDEKTFEYVKGWLKSFQNNQDNPEGYRYIHLSYRHLLAISNSELHKLDEVKMFLAGYETDEEVSRLREIYETARDERLGKISETSTQTFINMRRIYF